jgi:hypothetical protein
VAAAERGDSRLHKEFGKRDLLGKGKTPPQKGVVIPQVAMYQEKSGAYQQRLEA